MSTYYMQSIVLGSMDLASGLFCYYFWNRVSLCSPDWPEALYIAKVGLQLVEIHLPLLPGCWN